MENEKSFSNFLTNNENSLNFYKKGLSYRKTSSVSSIDGVNEMALRLRYRGGEPQQDRLIKDKRESLNRALYYSYQGALVKKYYQDYLELMDGVREEQPQRALINPNKLKQDYDDKIISIGFEAGYRPGDVFEWMNTGTYWLIYLQDLTELAYFRGDIRRCSFKISWVDEDGSIKNTYAAIRGPVETKINFIQKHGVSVDTPNHSLNILMPKNEDTIKYFKRYAKFYVAALDSPDPICWRVEATDSVSMQGILEINAIEYYANKDEDDLELGLVNSQAIATPVDPPEDRCRIKGEGFIRPRRSYVYTYNPLNDEKSQWSVDKKNLPIKFTQVDDYSIELKWDSSYSGQFNLSYGSETKTIVVESLF